MTRKQHEVWDRLTKRLAELNKEWRKESDLLHELGRHDQAQLLSCCAPEVFAVANDLVIDGSIDDTRIMEVHMSRRQSRERIAPLERTLSVLFPFAPESSLVQREMVQTEAALP